MEGRLINVEKKICKDLITIMDQLENMVSKIIIWIKLLTGSHSV